MVAKNKILLFTIALAAANSNRLTAEQNPSQSRPFEEVPEVTITHLSHRIQSLESTAPLNDLKEVLSDLQMLHPSRNGKEDQKRAVPWLELGIRFLGHLNKKIDPDFDPSDLRNVPSRNVEPPGGGYRSGIKPESIADDQVREAYKQRIEENRAKAEKLEHQRQLRMLQQESVELIRNVVRQSDFLPPSKVDAILKAEVSDEQFRQVLRQSILASDEE